MKFMSSIDLITENFCNFLKKKRSHTIKKTIAVKIFLLFIFFRPVI